MDIRLQNWPFFVWLLFFGNIGCNRQSPKTEDDFGPGIETIGSIYAHGDGPFRICGRKFEIDKAKKMVVTSITVVSSDGSPWINKRGKRIYDVSGTKYELKSGDNLIVFNGISKLYGPIPIDDYRATVDDHVRDNRKTEKAK